MATNCTVKVPIQYMEILYVIIYRKAVREALMRYCTAKHCRSLLTGTTKRIV